VAIRSLNGVAIHVVEEPARLAGGWLVRFASAGGHLALSGGNTVGEAYAAAAAQLPDWGEAHGWFGDERAVPPEDERSNFRLARERLLDVVSLRPREVHRIQGELGAEAAAAEYDAELTGVSFDLVLLGIGPDGHVTSLFPNQPTLDETERRAIPAEAKLEPYVDRVTMTLPVLCSAPEVLFLVSGEQKADAVERAFAQPPAKDTPASLVRSASGRTRVVADAAAAALLD
jgi:6-phosphogluconolactonase